jgi:hypothetical protein
LRFPPAQARAAARSTLGHRNRRRRRVALAGTAALVALVGGVSLVTLLSAPPRVHPPTPIPPNTVGTPFAPLPLDLPGWTVFASRGTINIGPLDFEKLPGVSNGRWIDLANGATLALSGPQLALDATGPARFRVGPLTSAQTAEPAERPAAPEPVALYVQFGTVEFATRELPLLVGFDRGTIQASPPCTFTLSFNNNADLTLTAPWPPVPGAEIIVQTPFGERRLLGGTLAVTVEGHLDFPRRDDEPEPLIAALAKYQVALSGKSKLPLPIALDTLLSTTTRDDLPLLWNLLNTLAPAPGRDDTLAPSRRQIAQRAHALLETKDDLPLDRLEALDPIAMNALWQRIRADRP